MGRDNNRKSMKMRRRHNQRKKQARLRRQAKDKRSERSGSRSS